MIDFLIVLGILILFISSIVGVLSLILRNTSINIIDPKEEKKQLQEWRDNLRKDTEAKAKLSKELSIVKNLKQMEELENYKKKYPEAFTTK